MNNSDTPRRVLYPGSFDPFTIGHDNIVQRALALFDEVVVAVGYNEHKQGTLTPEERVRAIQDVYCQQPRVRVIQYSGLTTQIAQQEGAVALVKGVRSMHDYEYEMQMADINRRLTGIETVVLFALPQLACVSSSMVRELAHFGQDVTPFTRIPQ